MKYFRIIILLMFAVFTNSTIYGQAKLSDCQKRVKELEARIESLEKLNTNLSNIINISMNASESTTQPSTNNTQKNEFYLHLEISRKSASETYERYNWITHEGGGTKVVDYSDSVKKVLIKSYENKFQQLKTYNSLTYLWTGFNPGYNSTTYVVKLGFFKSKQAAFEFATAYVPNEFIVQVKSVNQE